MGRAIKLVDIEDTPAVKINEQIDWKECKICGERTGEDLQCSAEEKDWLLTLE